MPFRGDAGCFTFGFMGTEKAVSVSQVLMVRSFPVLGLPGKIDLLLGKFLLILFPEDDNAEAHEDTQASEAWRKRNSAAG
jgi:hypothetical protein